MIKKLLTPIYLSAIFAILYGCAPSSYVVQDPTPSTVSYTASQNSAKQTITVNDKRPEDQKVFSYGILASALIHGEQEIDPIAYLKNHSQQELMARGIPVAMETEGNIQVDIHKLAMRNHRTNAYTPFITFTMLSADLTKDGNKERVAVYIKRGKTPVWSFDEIVQPTFNEPLDLLVKEFSAKLSDKLYGAKISDGEVQSLVKKINSEKPTDQTYRDVYNLGFGNNRSAIPALRELTKHESEYIRLAAISSLGMLGSDNQLELLQSIYTDSKLWQDRGMALKAIGDIGTAKANAFLKTVAAELSTLKEREALWNKEIIELYL